MAGETEEKPSGWTVDTLRAEIMGLLRERDKRLDERFIAQEKNITTANAATEKRFDAITERFATVNEFRQTLSDQATTFIARSEALALIKALDDKIDALEGRGAQSVGHSAGLTAAWGYLIAAVGLASAVVAIIIATR